MGHTQNVRFSFFLYFKKAKNIKQPIEWKNRSNFRNYFVALGKLNRTQKQWLIRGNSKNWFIRCNCGNRCFRPPLLASLKGQNDAMDAAICRAMLLLSLSFDLIHCYYTETRPYVMFVYPSYYISCRAHYSKHCNAPHRLCRLARYPDARKKRTQNSA